MLSIFEPFFAASPLSKARKIPCISHSSLYQMNKSSSGAMKQRPTLLVADVSMENINIFLAQLHFHGQRTKISFYALISLLLLSLLAYNSGIIFFTHVPFLLNHPSEPESFLQGNVTRNSRKFFSVSSSTKMPYPVLYSVKEKISDGNLRTHSSFLHKNPNFVTLTRKNAALYRPRRRKRHRRVIEVLTSEVKAMQFEDRVMQFFNSNSYCEFQFFMTWISSIESFGDRELLAIQSLFKAHPNGCLIIASNSMDSRNGMLMLRPFLDRGFRVTAMSPDFNFLFKNTAAKSWYNNLIRGNIRTGGVSLGQNLSNLLRLGLLYRFGGIYLDTDVIVLKSFRELKNSIGAQTMDLETGKWSRLNNAVMIFDKGHPLLSKFIEEFALTFNGNKWGHNGPYLVSRVISRLSGRLEYNVTVLPPMAFYPVDWSRIGSLFYGPRNASHSRWLLGKLRQIYGQSFAVHLWNKQSKGYKVEEGSIIQHMMSSSCVLCNSSSLAIP